jgi:hypothetical protein
MAEREPFPSDPPASLVNDVRILRPDTAWVAASSAGLASIRSGNRQTDAPAEWAA